MSALVVRPVEDEIGIGRACPSLWCLVDLITKRTDPCRERDSARIEEAALATAHGPVEPRRRDRRFSQPVERDVVEYVVASESLLRPVEDIGDQTVALDIVVEDPGRQADWRV